MSDERPKTIRVPSAPRLDLPSALVLGVIVGVFAVGAAYATFKGTLDEVPALKLKVEENSRTLGKIDVMANDIAWIKAELLRQRNPEARVVSAGSR